MPIQPKKRRGNARGAANQAQLEARQVLAVVQPLIRENVIDISGASKFFKKKADVATLLKGFVEALPNSQFRLSNGFDAFFLRSLPVFLNGYSLKPADALAEALFFLGRQWARIDYGDLPIASPPTDEFLRTQWKEADTWDAFVRSDACFGEIWWRNLGADGKVSVWLGGCNPGDFELRVDFGPDAAQAPTMKIRIKGEPAAVFMNWWMALGPNSPAGGSPLNHPGTEALREKAESALEAIVGRLKVDLKLNRPNRGRPRIDFGEQVAYRLDHEKQNFALIAQQLCNLPKNASALLRRQTFDRIRKAANNYYNLLRSDYTTLTRTRIRQRLIWLRPGNPSPVKSE